MDFTNFKEKIDFSPGSLVRKNNSKEFEQPKWELFRKWFFKNFEKQTQMFFKEEYYKDLTEKNEIIFFVPWFIERYTETIVSVLERNFEINGKTISNVFPPTNTIFKIGKEGEYFQAFQKLLEGDTLPVTISHINVLIKQQNYNNLYLIILGEQLQDLSKKIDKILEKVQDKQQNAVEKGKEIVATPSIQLPPKITDFKIKSDESLIKALNESVIALKNLHLNTLTDINNENYQQKIQDEILKMSKFADNPLRESITTRGLHLRMFS